MTYGKILKQEGINVEGTDKYELFDFWGKTPKGNIFYMFRCNSFLMFTVKINGKVLATRCKFRTGIKIIKEN